MTRNYTPRPRRRDHYDHQTRTTVSDTSVVFECLDCGVGIARPRCVETNGKTGQRCVQPCHPKATLCFNHARAQARRAHGDAPEGTPAGEDAS